MLTAISPIDGRYASKTKELSDYFSEYALIKYRVFVEIQYFKALCEIPLPQLADFDKSLYGKIRAIYLDFSNADALKIKEIEKGTCKDFNAINNYLNYFSEPIFETLQY